MADVVYIGQVKRVHESYGKPYRHATVEPLVQSSEDRKRWEGAIAEPLVTFPTRGFVYWHDAPTQLKEGDIRQFEVEDHPFYKGEPGKEQFQVKNAKPLTEILDLRNIGSERDIRLLLTTDGVSLNAGLLSAQCVLWVQDEKCVGPVDMVRRADTGTWVVSPKQDVDSLKCWKIVPETIQQVKLNGTRYLLAPNQETFGQRFGFVNWEADEILAKRVFNHLWRQDRKTAEAFKISKDVFRTYVETVESARLIGPNADREKAFYERIKEIVDFISQNEEFLNEAASICFDMDQVQEKVAEKAELEYQKKLAENETHLDEALTTKREELSRKEQELADIKEKLQTLEKKLEERTAGFTTELEERLRVIAEKPERLFAEMAIANALIPKARPTHTAARTAARRQIIQHGSDVRTIEASSVFMGDLSRRLVSVRISPMVGRALHSTFLAGLVPVLVGPGAYDVVSSYADCVSAGVLHWIPVGGSIFEPSDLLARFDPVSRCLVPHPGGLLNLLLDESDEVHIVVLDGFNRAAVDGYLIGLLQCVQDAARGRKPRSIPLAPSGFVSNDNMYADVSRVGWNSSVLLTLCPSSGASTLSVPTELWNYCAVIDTNEPAPTEAPLEPESIPPITRVPTSIWKSWVEGVREKIEPLEVLRKESSEGEALPSIFIDNVEKMCGSGAALGLKPESAMRQAVRTSLLPYLVVDEKPVDTWFRHLGIALNEADQRIMDTVRRLGE